jgi:hypothetical protein
VLYIAEGTILFNMAVNGKAESVTDDGVATPVKQQIKWYNVIALTAIHLLALYGTLVVLPRLKLMTFVWCKWH